MSTARGRLKGALMDVLEPNYEESDASSDYTTDKHERFVFKPIVITQSPRRSCHC